MIIAKIKKILKKLFDFEGDDDELIFNQIDSVKYFRYLLTLENEFNVDLSDKDISTVNKTLQSIENEINQI